jgi:two-component system, cell cycle sensor histidine kinase and response regulator CckA
LRRSPEFQVPSPGIDEIASSILNSLNLEAEPMRDSETIDPAKDEKLLRTLICDSLVKGGYKVLEAPDGWDALRIVKEYEGGIDLLLTETVMPFMGARESVQRLLGLQGKTKVLLTTGYGMEWLATLAQRLGIEMDYAPKPLTAEALTLKVRELLEEDFQRKQPRATAGMLQSQEPA